LKPYLDRFGLLVYSPAATLRPDNRVMYWGYNPGQCPCIHDETHWTIRKSIEGFPTQICLINEQRWPNARMGTSVVDGEERYAQHHGTGRAPYQCGVRHILRVAGHPDALVTNFLFFQTRSVEHLRPTKEQIDCCWQVHKFLMQKTKARVLITTAGVAREICRSGLMDLCEVDRRPSGYGRWNCKLYENRSGLPAVITAPHMSYWGSCIAKVEYEPALKWIKERVDRLTE
jgi:hypothetical protein